MAQAMEKDRVIELLEYYKDIDGEVNIYRKIISDLTDQYYNPIGAIQCDGLPKGKNNISRQTENMALNIPDYVSGEIREYEAKAQQLQALKAQILQEVSRLKLKEKRIIFDFYIHTVKDSAKISEIQQLKHFHRGLKRTRLFHNFRGLHKQSLPAIACVLLV